MKIALVQTNPVIGDFSHNTANMLTWLAKAEAQGCRLAIFPEMAVSGYPPQDLLERPAFLKDQQRAVARLAEQCHGIALLCGMLTSHTGPSGKLLHNSAVLLEEGREIFAAHKRLLPTYDVFDETRYFEPGGQSRSVAFDGLTLGITVCEDIWNDRALFPRPLYGADPVAELLAHAPAGLDLLINIAASPFHLGKTGFKLHLLRQIAGGHSLPLLYVNQVGGQDSLLFDGQSLAMDQYGRIVARARRFAEDMVVLDTDLLRGPPPAGEEHAVAGEPPEDEVAMVHEGLVMGIRDYALKCGFRTGLLGLSGGIDSAVTATLAAEALGPAQVYGVALPSPYSSPESVEDARALAANLGIHFTVLPIEALYRAELETLQPLFAGRPADVTEQNIQARLRGNLLMALSNKFGHLLLSTGNKSEMAVGYCTLYGDMSGGLAAISDVPKGLVYRLAHYLNRQGEIIPVRSITKPPSAELAPGQKDQDDLPPYEILDGILQAYLEENRSIQEIVAAGYERLLVEDVVRRIAVNEYKRKQAPPGLKITTKAFGQGRRYPIAARYREGSP